MSHNAFQNIIDSRHDKLDWYVLIYNIKTTEYLNEIEFQTYEDALKKYNETPAKGGNISVEIIFSPEDDDEEYFENVVIYSK